MRGGPVLFFNRLTSSVTSHGQCVQLMVLQEHVSFYKHRHPLAPKNARPTTHRMDVIYHSRELCLRRCCACQLCLFGHLILLYARPRSYLNARRRTTVVPWSNGSAAIICGVIRLHSTVCKVIFTLPRHRTRDGGGRKGRGEVEKNDN